MRIALTALTPRGPADVIVSGDDGATAGQVAEALADAFAPKEHLASVIMHPRAATAGARLTPRGPVLWVGGQQVAPDTPAARALRDGAVVTTLEGASAATSLAEPGGVAELRVIGGPDAGTVHRLGPGVTTIGSGPGCQVRLASPGVPAHAATVTVAWGLNVPSLDPAGPGLTLDGKQVSEACAWPFGGVLRISTAVLQLMRPEAPDAHLSPAGSGLAYHRPPRFRPDMQPVKIQIPAEPKKGHGNGAAMLLAALIPMAMGGVMVYISKQWLYALFMLMSPLMVAGNWLTASRQRGGSHRRKMRAYTAQLAEAETKLEQAREADEKKRREDAMDPAQVLLTATGPRRRLWERRADDPDTLRIRVGMFDGPAMIQLVPGAKDATPPAVPVSFCVPVSMSLAKLGVVGLAGPVDASRALARWIVAQAAVLHSPRDLSIVVLAADPAVGSHWNWVRWLPHCAPRGGEDCVALVGADMDSAAKRVTELVAEVSARLAKVPPGQDGGGFGGGAGASAEPVASSDLGPKIMVVLDGARQLRRIQGMPQLLANARRTGVYAVCIDESARVLPEECAAVLSWDIPGQGNGNHHGVRVGPGGWTVASHGAAPSPVRPFLIRGHGGPFGQGGPAMLADQVSVGWADRVARALAPVRDVSRDDSDSAIPDSARLLDLIHMPDPSPELVLMAWRKRGRTTKIPIGVSADGPFILDLSADGPHGLVAGTTGAGKSELLQTIIAVLCVANRPDAMTFVLIDYKGGSAFKDCARLPHTVGMVSDLDGHLTVRALDSLGAELKRREEMLLHSGAKDIEDYWDTKRLRPEMNLEPMPRLVLLIDEFAAMVAELPDFVDGLIDIARRGRSLGVHLILASQRPAGVVSADIRANTNLRIALRVTSSDESADVIDAPDSAYIAKSTPGRCYVRSGASNLVAVQSARIGGRRPGSGPVAASARVMTVPWRGLGRGLPAPGRAAGADEETMETDLSVLVDAIAAANRKAGLGQQRRPWLEPLPEIVTLGDLPTAVPAAPAGRADVPPIPYGLTDLPHRQSREPLTLDFGSATHTVVAGAARTGRSSLLRTLAGAVATRVSPADVHIYGIDCGAGALLPVSELPHCGAVVAREQVDRVERLLSKLRNEIARRQQLLAAQGFAGLAEQRAATAGEARLPWMLLLLDWWEGYYAAFGEYDMGRLVDTLLQVLREGSAVGLRAVVTTDRSAMLGQIGTVFGHRMIFRLTDRSDSSFAEIKERALPAHQPDGRLMFHAKPNPLEAQVALLDPDPTGLAQVGALRRIAAEARQRYGRQLPRACRPLRVDALPPRITVAETYRLDPDFAPPSPLWAMVGAGGDELSAQGFDVAEEGPGIVVAGPPRSGRSTTLITMARSLIAQQTPVLLIAPRRSPLRSLEGTPGVLAVLGAELDVEYLRATLNPLDRYVVLADDAEMLYNALNSEILERIIISGRDADHGLILAGNTVELASCYSGFIATARKSRCGVLVAVDTPDDGDLFGVRLPRNAGPGPLGRGLLFRSGRAAPIQLAIDEGTI